MKICRTYLSKQFCIVTIYSYFAYFTIVEKVLCLIEAKNINLIKKCLDENLYNLFKRAILHYNVFSISRIFCLKIRIFDFQKCLFKSKEKYSYYQKMYKSITVEIELFN